MMENQILWYALISGCLALFYGVFLIYKILKKPAGSGKMLEIASAIQEGAKAYLSRQYKTVGIVAIAVVAIMYFTEFSANTIYAFILGAVSDFLMSEPIVYLVGLFMLGVVINLFKRITNN
jgi:K(+)-stimulated pyrophosphate-energized sodium pump